VIDENGELWWNNVDRGNREREGISEVVEILAASKEVLCSTELVISLITRNLFRRLRILTLFLGLQFSFRRLLCLSLNPHSACL
jgi:hypothetical protein